MNPDEWRELMEEAPGGENHGRVRAGGSWMRLDGAAHEYAESGFDYFVDIETHGLRSTYQAGCRCDPCRRAERDYRRKARQKGSESH